MRASNLVVLRGRTTADIELKEAANELHYCNFTLAVDRPYRKGTDREADFIHITAYRSTADFLTQYVSKGTMISVTGELRVRSWEDGEGNRRSRMDVIADQIEFAETKGNGTHKQGGEANPSAAGGAAAQADDEDDDLPF